MQSRPVLVLAAVFVTGCGAILHGSRQDIEVQSSPSGAKVATAPESGEYTTPTRLSLERRRSYVLTFTAPGYAPATFSIRNGIGVGTVIADVLLTGLVGVAVDGFTGSWYGLSPENATVTLSRIGGSENGADAIHISVGMSKHGESVRVSSTSPDVRVTVTSK